MFEKICDNEIYKILYNGEWINSRNNKTIEILSPVDNSLVGKIQALTKEEVDEIIKNSKESQKAWGNLPISERASILHKAAAIIEENADELSQILQLEIAKDIESSQSEIKRTADFIRFTADEGKHMQGETILSDNFPGFKRDRVSVVYRVPVGVVLAISPFNYPINLSASKIAPALIAGNSVILKPPTQGAISALYLAETFNKAGLPKGILNTITGKSSEIGDYLITHKDINFINFTGSTEVGKHIAEIAGMVPMLMELGGKDAAIVLEDADLNEAAKLIVSGAYNYSGQRCTAVKRVLALEAVADKLIQNMTQEITKLKVGAPKEGAKITPLINSAAADFVQELIDDAINKGAKLIIGNKREGNLIYPTLFDYVTTAMRLAWEEPFGPILPVIRVQNVDEAIAIANKSQYGLQASVFTQNIKEAFYVADKLEVGTVHINNKTERGPDHFPFLGVKASGLGTQGIRYSIEAMSRPKVVVLNIN
ncbi:NADP-dependent glyceraldehyde-3-phosphate dehydrogenase [Clostridium sp. SYSU_GA19001]|uniref:NADP-dependent glyceraldehyde-3-phosphate dehydrogenase n=1 Tax=Clostridium caldaquaticum TaxID=2940653 RepID=UPI0020777AE5|nr:NADP-dependent glyceraldehyde-3-phosphate dehydrogenase [Clostridium caldaquaticum]MCM8711686.1 NADP-dependent glyceraldehyde-3-phosphate dehydrogenase [Clostridium caldaquaticum]